MSQLDLIGLQLELRGQVKGHRARLSTVTFVKFKVMLQLFSNQCAKLFISGFNLDQNEILKRRGMHIYIIMIINPPI